MCSSCCTQQTRLSEIVHQIYNLAWMTTAFGSACIVGNPFFPAGNRRGRPIHQVKSSWRRRRWRRLEEHLEPRCNWTAFRVSTFIVVTLRCLGITITLSSTPSSWLSAPDMPVLWKSGCTQCYCCGSGSPSLGQCRRNAKVISWSPYRLVWWW